LVGKRALCVCVCNVGKMNVIYKCLAILLERTFESLKIHETNADQMQQQYGVSSIYIETAPGVD